MMRNKESVSVSGMSILFMLMLNAVVVRAAFTASTNWYWLLLITVPLLIIALSNRKMKVMATAKHPITSRRRPVRMQWPYFTFGKKPVDHDSPDNEWRFTKKDNSPSTQKQMQ